MAVYPPVSADNATLNAQGIDHLVAAPGPGVGLQAFKVTQSGAAPCVVAFADIPGAVAMADAAYVVLVGGENSADVVVDESTIATTGFSLLGGADGEVHHLLIGGRLAGQKA